MNLFFQYQNKSFMLKKALRMSRVVAQRAEEHVSKNAVAIAIPATDKNVKCLKPFVLNVVRKLPFRLNQLVTDRFIAATVFRLDASR